MMRIKIRLLNQGFLNMIIARSPLRITLGGGGTDLPSYYAAHEGFVLSAAIDKYVYVSVMRPFSPGLYLKYSEIEHVDVIEEIKHPIIRETLKLAQFTTSQIEMSTFADIPAGTGLGSSGSFTTALLKAMHAHNKYTIAQNDLAELACTIEIDRLREPVGKQDQYIAAFGGIKCFTFHQDHRVTIDSLNVSKDTLLALEENMLLFFTGFSRSASTILKEQHHRSLADDRDMITHLHYVKELGYRCKHALEQGAVIEFGELMHEHWEHKKHRSRQMSNSLIDQWYRLGKDNGAVGGKLVGAGGGGFLMFLAHDRDRLRQTMNAAGLEEVRFRFDFEGTQLVMSS